MGMDAKVIIADLQLLCAAGLYGFGFAAQRAAMIEGMGPLTFNACRYIVSMVCNQKDMSIPNCRYIDVYRYILPRIIPLNSYFMFLILLFVCVVYTLLSVLSALGLFGVRGELEVFGAL